MTTFDYTGVIAGIFASEGASRVAWEQATRCSCWTDDTHQPEWGCQVCSGHGVEYSEPIVITALFRAQSRWTSNHMGGEHSLGEAQLTTLPEHKPGYVDRRVRDRFTIVPTPGDAARGRIFLPAADPVPFVINDRQEAWRVQLQSLEQATRTTPAP